MPNRRHDRKIELRCPTCTGTQFQYDDDLDADNASVRCIGCDRVLAKDELIRENAENIDAHASEIGKKVIDDFALEMKRRLRSAFRGSKHIKFK